MRNDDIQDDQSILRRMAPYPVPIIKQREGLKFEPSLRLANVNPLVAACFYEIQMTRKQSVDSKRLKNNDGALPHDKSDGDKKNPKNLAERGEKAPIDFESRRYMF